MNKYNKGRRYEYEVKNHLEEMGALVLRTAGSHSPIDLIAIWDNKIWAIQCKSIKKINSKTKQECKEFHNLSLHPVIEKFFYVNEDGKEVAMSANGDIK